MSIFLRLITWLFATLFIAVVVLFVCMPWWLRPVLETALSDVMEQPVHIQSVQLEPSSGLLLVAGVDIGQLGLRQLQLHIRLAALWQHRIEVVSLRLESLTLTLIDDKKGIHIAGLPSSPSKHTAKRNNDTDTPWTIQLQQIDVQYARIYWQRSALKQKAALYLYWLHAEQEPHGGYTIKARWQAEAALPRQGVSHAMLEGKLEGELSNPMATSVPDFSGQISLRPIQVDGYSVHVQTAGIDWDGYTRAIGNNINVYSKLTLQKSQVQWAQQTLMLSGLTWHGSMHFSPSKANTEIQGLLQVSSISLAVDHYSRLAVQGIHWQGGIKHDPTTTAITGSWKILDVYATQKSKRISIDKLTWNGLLKHENDKIMAKGRGEINNANVSLGEQNVQLNNFSWDGLLQQNGQQHLIQGDWQMAGIQLRQPDGEIQLKQWHWQGQVNSTLKGQHERLIHGSQTLSLQGLRRKADDAQQDLALLQWDGSWQLQLAANQNIRFNTNTKNQINISRLSLYQPNIGTLKMNDARWNGDIETTWCKHKHDKKSCTSNIKSQGRLRLTALHIPLSHDHYTNIQHIQWQGLINADRKNQTQQATLGGSLSVNHVYLNIKNGIPELATLKLDGLNIAATQTLQQRQLSLSLRNMVAERGVWPATDKTSMLVQLQKVALSQLHIKATQHRGAKSSAPKVKIHAKKLHLTGIQAAWKRPKDQATSNNHVTSMVSESSKEAPKWAWRLDQFILDGDNKIALLDQHIIPAWQATFSQVQATMGAISSSEPNTKTPLELSAKLSPAGSVKIKGVVILQEKTSKHIVLDGHVRLQGVDAAPFSGYVEAVSGYALQRGTVYANLEGKLLGSTLDSTLHLKLQHLEVIAKQQTAIDTLRGLVGLSPDAALDTLRDNDDEIALDIPIKGDLKAPDFHLQDVIQQALGGSLQKAAMMYLQYAFQPYGALLEAAMWVGEQVHAIRLPSITFPHGLNTSTDKNKNDILQKAADFLIKNPKMSLALCGHAIASDAYAQTATEGENTPPKDHDWLLNLANQRAESLIYILRNRMHVPVSQLQRCRPTLTPKGQAEVKLLL